MNDIAEQLQNTNKVYKEVDKPGATHLKFELFYDKGGMSYFSGQIQRRGYYLSVRYVTRKDMGTYMSESFGVFDGTKYFLNNQEVKRNSPKALAEARANITTKLLEMLVGSL